VALQRELSAALTCLCHDPIVQRGINFWPF
jgi:hypothetical protein